MSMNRTTLPLRLTDNSVYDASARRNVSDLSLTFDLARAGYLAAKQNSPDAVQTSVSS